MPVAFAGFVEGFGQVFLFVYVVIDLLNFLVCPGSEEYYVFEGFEEEVDGMWIMAHIAFFVKIRFIFYI